MEQINALRALLLTFPLWGQQPLFIDSTDAAPECCGLFPLGLRELERREDVLGGVKERHRLRAMVYRVAGQEEDFARDAAWWEDFAAWVAAQSAAGLAPRFGNTQDREFVQARGGRLVRMPSAGTGVYGVEIVAEYWTRM